MIGTVELDAVFIGKAMPRWPGRPPSGIGKTRTAGRLRLTSTGLTGDEQADLAVHGGLEKAMHHYAADNYAFWKEQLPQKTEHFVAGGFGENISTRGLTEKDICIGDVFRIGGAVVQVTQGRQPCWKLSEHIGLTDMAARFQKSGLTGWYYRVIEEGFIEEGCEITLVERPQPNWPLPTVIASRFDPALCPDIARQLAELEEMSRSWHAAFVKKSNPAYQEDTRARVLGK